MNEKLKEFWEDIKPMIMLIGSFILAGSLLILTTIAEQKIKGEKPKMTIFIVGDGIENKKAFREYGEALEYCEELNKDWRERTGENENQYYYYVESLDLQ